MINDKTLITSTLSYFPIAFGQDLNTKPIGDMVLLLNDAFDVLNGRCSQESINSDNFDDKSKVN